MKCSTSRVFDVNDTPSFRCNILSYTFSSLYKFFLRPLLTFFVNVVVVVLERAPFLNRGVALVIFPGAYWASLTFANLVRHFDCSLNNWATQSRVENCEKRCDHSF